MCPFSADWIDGTDRAPVELRREPLHQDKEKSSAMSGDAQNKGTLLRRVLHLQLCPKASLHKISEFGPVVELFSMAKAKKWKSYDIACTYLVCRGIRGREGVQVLHAFMRKRGDDVLNWGNDAHVLSFVDYFEHEWQKEVIKARLPSALSHQEGRHAGLSGMNFVETLKIPCNRHVLFRDVAVRLAPFFDEPAQLSPQKLLDFYTELVATLLPLSTDSFDVQRKAARLLGKNLKIRSEQVKSRIPHASDMSYNSMDFLRLYSNIMTKVFMVPEVLFTTPLWDKMLKCQLDRSLNHTLVPAKKICTICYS